MEGHRGSVWSIGFNPSGSRLVSAGGVHSGRSAGEFKLWDTAIGAELMTISAGKGPIYGVAFSPDGTRLATAGGVVKIWNGMPLAEKPNFEPLSTE